MKVEAVYGDPPLELADYGADAVRLSPLHPGRGPIEDLATASLTRAVVLAPPGVLERRYVLAHALRALQDGGELVALAPKDRGGSRLKKELEGFGCAVIETAKRHHRICQVRRPPTPTGLDAAIAEGGRQIAKQLGLWSQPGVFSWDRVDPGTALLLSHAGSLSGRGADFGCGVGVLALKVLASPAVTGLALIDIDARAIAAARRNVDDPRVTFLQHDLRTPPPGLADLDFVVMNPPFHMAGAEDRSLGQTFIRRAAAALRRGGVCRLVANIGMPYEAVLAECFSAVTPLGQGAGYKLFEARK
ncbi:class I SAM-dependent methyltransferase [Phenylobacterium montanum]|uniref:Class I SAM-dependent methyltransferase n=1 Tax=Phenylobacterium montanum TaxID=2823693 RepID=A0A975FW71_9CAUL|nr:methyltransferase [Caulobacter sp. S6]QUD86094.1 class I SAM-dependent methyltransferase [Caulobacter sp. S6]